MTKVGDSEGIMQRNSGLTEHRNVLVGDKQHQQEIITLVRGYRGSLFQAVMMPFLE